MWIRTGGIAAMLCSVVAGTPALAANDTPLPEGCALADAGPGVPLPAAKPGFPVNQLQVRTPFAPTVLPSDGRHYLIYELHLQNLASAPQVVRSIEVIDADSEAGKPVAAFRDGQLAAALHPTPFDEEHGARTRLGARQGVVAFLCVAFDGKAAIPRSLRHRVQMDGSFADGPAVARHGSAPVVLGRPVAGSDWVPMNGPHIHSHHRMGLWVTNGEAQLSRRYAIDWRIHRGGAWFSGDEGDVRSYHAYAQPVLAVADGTIVSAHDGMPDNQPRTAAGFELAAALTQKTLAGNMVAIDLGNGQYAFYAHLQPGSVRVKAGDRVRRGQPLGKIGNSGDSRWPHLHFQVSTSAAGILEGEGTPFVFDQYRIKMYGKDWEARSRDFPWGNNVLIDFGAAAPAAQR